MVVGRVRIFSFPGFDDYAKKQRWSDDRLIKVVEDVERGLNDGVLGSNLFKRRVAREGSGSSGGFRVVLVCQVGHRAFLVEAFAKNVKTSHTPQEVRALRELADQLLVLSETQIALAIEANQMREIKRTDENSENEAT